jgi:hypothetical protein
LSVVSKLKQQITNFSYHPIGHSKHASSGDWAPALVPILPGGQLTQSFGFFNPIAAEYLPASQPTHAEKSLLPYSVL